MVGIVLSVGYLTMSEYDIDKEHFPAAKKHELNMWVQTNHSDEEAHISSVTAGDLTAQEKPERTEEMVRKGLVWVEMNYPDGSKGWEMRGTGAIIRKDPNL